MSVTEQAAGADTDEQRVAALVDELLAERRATSAEEDRP